MADSEQHVAAAASTPPEPQSVGQILKQARLARDLSLEQMSTELRIEAQQLEALEQDRFERIGVPVFVKGYIRQYGTRLGLDIRDLLVQYYKQNSLKDVQIQPSKTIKLRDERQITVWIIAMLDLGCARRGARRLVVERSFARRCCQRPRRRRAPSRRRRCRPQRRRRPEVHRARLRRSSRRRSSAGNRAGPAERIRSSSGRRGASFTAPRRTTPAMPASRFARSRPCSRSHSCKTAGRRSDDARGERLFYGLGAAGRNEKLEGELPFAVVLGNSAGVKMLLRRRRLSDSDQRPPRRIFAIQRQRRRRLSTTWPS